MKYSDWELTKLDGIKRQKETTDKPSNHPDLIRDMRQNQDGVWEKRPASGYAYPDRGNQFEFITPEFERGINSLPDGAESGISLGQYERYYNSHRRKQIVHIGRWRFKGVIEDHNVSGQRQRFQIWRGYEQGDHKSVVWDTEPAYHIVYGQMDNECYFVQPDAGGGAFPDRIPYNDVDVDVDGSWIQYSMVAAPDGLSIYVAIILKMSGLGDKILWVVTLTSLFETGWGGASGYPLWTGVGNAGIGTDGKIVVTTARGGLSMTVDMEIASNNDLHLIYGYYDTGEDLWKLKYQVYTASTGQWTGATGNEVEIKESLGDIFGAVLKKSVAALTPALYLGYLKFSGSTYTLLYRTWDIGANPPASSSGSIATAHHDAMELNGLEEFFGPALSIDNDDTLVWGWRNTNPREIRVKWGASASAVGHDGILDSLLYYYTNWDIVAKAGIVVLYYGTQRHSSRLFNPDHIVERRIMIGDTADFEYTDGTFFDADLVEEAELFSAWDADGNQQTKPMITTYIAAFNTYESDNLKDISLVTLARQVVFLSPSSFRHIRQDEGVYGGVSQVTMGQPHRWDAQEIIGDQAALQRITALQCSVDFQDNTIYPFYERRDWQWMLMKGQMSESNGQIIKSTHVADSHANFTDLFYTLRAGCGIDDDNNRAIWYGLINRRFFRHTDFVRGLHGIGGGGGAILSAEAIRLRARRWAHMPRPYPDIGQFTIGYIIEGDAVGAVDDAGAMTRRSVAATDVLFDQEPEGTGGYDDSALIDYHYTRFCPKRWRLNWNDNPDERSFENGGVFVDQATFPYPVSHPYRLVETDVGAYLDGNLGTLPTEQREQPFIEIFLGFSYRFFDGQSSPIVAQVVDTAYTVGLRILTMHAGGMSAQFISMLKVVMTQLRWDIDAGIDPRVEAIEVHVAEKMLPNQTKWDVPYRKAGEVLVSKLKDNFKGEPWNGDAEWDTTDGQTFTFDFYLDLKRFLSSVEQSDDINHLGFSPPVLRHTDQSPMINGFKYMRVVKDRAFYFPYRMNGTSHVDKTIWGGEAVRGKTRLQLVDYASPSIFKGFPFEIKNGAELGEGNLVVVGDRDIQWGRVVGSEFSWQIEGVAQNVGTFSAESVALVAELSEAGGLNGLFFLSNKDVDNPDESGGRIFDLFKSTPITQEILRDAVVGGMPVATRVETTHKGIESLAATDAMAMHLPLQRLLFVHFPTLGITMVRDFRGENNAESKRKQWSEWRLGKNPLAWCLAPEGYLLYTDREFLYRWPDADGADTDAGTTISPKIRLNTAQIPAKTNAQINEITLDYECVGSTVTVTLIRDDGTIVDKALTFPATTTRARTSRRFGYAFPFRRQFSIQIEPTTPSACTAFKVHGIAGDREWWSVG